MINKTQLATLIANKATNVIWGGPGQGKLATVKEAVAEMDGKNTLIDFRTHMAETADCGRSFPGGSAQPTTLFGIELAFASQYDNIVLYLDRITEAQPAVQDAVKDLILNRECFGIKLPENVTIIISAGRDETAFLPIAMQNKLIQIEV